MSPERENLAATRRREATRAAVRYFVLFFTLFALMGGVITYAVRAAHAQDRRSYAIRVEYCNELEKLKKENREDVASDKRHYKRNLRLLGIKDTPELRKVAEQTWAKKLRRNAPKPCPYTA